MGTPPAVGLGALPPVFPRSCPWPQMAAVGLLLSGRALSRLIGRTRPRKSTRDVCKVAPESADLEIKFQTPVAAQWDCISLGKPTKSIIWCFLCQSLYFCEYFNTSFSMTELCYVLILNEVEKELKALSFTPRPPRQPPWASAAPSPPASAQGSRQV